MNRNLIVLFDRDNDFLVQPEGQPKLINETSYKARIWHELGNTPNSAIVTDTYSIEGYLPKGFFDKYFKYDGIGKMELNTTYSKVEIAKKFRRLEHDLESHQYPKNLIKKLNQIVDALIDWNT
ncbi:MAG: hypothetical protein WA071_22370 [Undibacterium umbellatum]|uniref:hypothetical protein n=1 Tax=Undibacterium umbellatum TaxID=2762300 RepID=UPI003BB67527